MTTNNLRTSEVLNRAADMIEERGWVRGKGWGPDDGGLCLEGALIAASGLSAAIGKRLAVYTQCPAYDAVVAYLGKDPQPRIAPIVDTLWAWNDARSEVTEVIEVLRAVAVIEAARENAETRDEVSA